MDPIEIRVDCGGDELGQLLWDRIVPEMRRLAKARQRPFMEPADPGIEKNVHAVTLAAIESIRAVILLAFRANGKVPPLIRIEMRTFRNAYARIRFIALDDHREPVLPEKENPVVLFLASAADLEACRKEGYTTIWALDF